MLEQKISDDILKWLSAKLDRAYFVEKKLTALIKKDCLDSAEQKRFVELQAESKNLAIKDMLAVYQAVKTENGIGGFEDFD